MTDPSYGTIAPAEYQARQKKLRPRYKPVTMKRAMAATDSLAAIDRINRSIAENNEARTKIQNAKMEAQDKQNALNKNTKKDVGFRKSLRRHTKNVAALDRDLNKPPRGRPPALRIPGGTGGRQGIAGGTPARADSKRGEFKAGNIFYTGRAKPDKKAWNTDKQWELFSGHRDFNTNSMAALMEFNLHRLMERLMKMMKEASPPGVAAAYFTESGRQGSQVWIRMGNAHPAFMYLLAGTAEHRRIDWKAEHRDGDSHEAYPIIPIRGPWAKGSKGYMTKEERYTRIELFQQVLEDAAEDEDNDGEEGYLSPAVEWTRHKLKLDGNWVPGPASKRDPGSKFVPDLHKNIDREDDDDFEFTGKAGRNLGKRKRGNSRGEVFMQYVMEHPGIKANTKMTNTFLKFARAKNIKAFTTPIASAMVREVAQAILTGNSFHAQRQEGQTTRQFFDANDIIRRPTLYKEPGRATIHIVLRSMNGPATENMRKAIESSNARRARRL
jgi:hypothetical protein